MYNLVVVEEDNIMLVLIIEKTNISVETTLALNCLAFGGRVAYVHAPQSDLPHC
jgi:hypothetical protein